MIETHLADGANGDWIELRPNQSLSWAQIRMIGVILAIPAVFIAVGFLIAGVWMIVPFSGLELAAVTTTLWLVSLNGQKREVVRFSGDSVTVEKGRYGCQSRRTFQRHWSRFEIECSNHPWYAPRIILKQHDRQEEIGAFLSEDEKGILIAELRGLVQNAQRLDAAHGS